MSLRLRPGRNHHHAVQRGKVRHGGDNQPNGILKTNEASIKEMVDRRSKQKSILSVEPFLVARISPEFPVASVQVSEIADACDSTFLFDLHYPPLEKSLSPPRHD